MNQEKQVQVKMTDEVMKGVFANVCQIGHTAEEFVMDFMNLLGEGSIVTARVVITPGHAKRFAEALNTNVKAYEDKYGAIVSKIE